MSRDFSDSLLMLGIFIFQTSYKESVFHTSRLLQIFPHTLFIYAEHAFGACEGSTLRADGRH